MDDDRNALDIAKLRIAFCGLLVFFRTQWF